MKINLNDDREIIEEVFNVLMEYIDTFKVVRFLQICNLRNGDYSQIKEKLFQGETVDTLYEKIKAINS